MKKSAATFDFLAFIGRFQPFHIGHRHVLELALAQSKRVIVLVGSANLARSAKNPFSFEERARMIRAVFPSEAKSGRIIIRPLDDYAYNETAWVTAVQREINRTVLDAGNGGSVVLHGLKDFKTGIVGFMKDASSYYLRLFPELGFVEIEKTYGTFSAADIRADYLRRAPRLPRDLCPPEVVDELDRFRLTPEFARIVGEAEWIADYKKQWERAPYPPVFVTVDCVVQQSGHVLLVERGEHPGKGLLALPGGFLSPGEFLREAALRELREETGIADGKGPIPPAMLASFIEDSATRVFDAPDRSERGRTITHAFLFRCPDRPQLFAVKGGDDAAHASWHRLGDLDPKSFFEDHWFILQSMIGI